MPFLLTESLDAARREETHQHIENCAVCSEEWSAYQDTWRMMDDLSEVVVPPAVKDRFLAAAGIAPQRVETNVVPFRRKPALKWVAQAAAVVLLAGGGYFFGTQTPQAPTAIRGFRETPSVKVEPANFLSIAETRTVDASALNPQIEGRPNINNVTFLDGDASDEQIKVAFDITSRWTVSGNPRDKSMVRLLSYMLESEAGIAPRSNALDVVRRAYSDPANADPEIAQALAKVLRNDEHEGVRIRALDTLSNLPANVAPSTRDALIEALKNDPNPAVRLKAVEALTNMAQSGATLDADAVNTLRLKAAQDDENLYVRVKAAEALSNIKP
jgi:hypothetical protein